MSQLRAIVERIERIEADIAEMNSDKSDIFKEAKANGFDVKALKAVIAYRRKDPAERSEQEALFDLYLAEVSGKSSSGTDPATRARTTPPAKVSIAAGTASPAVRPVVQAQPLAAPATPAPFDFPDLPGHLDRRPQ